ncbi:hypothetical protein LAZ67_4003444 [Cordylochernes scorpioides]|uniref:RNase H type-1 domain-containing protein n=1 Tax=Cordylochernes scorpioides TaxID=51811 RepID=A0ABY6KDP8_9ARAC|nr:hypothetical protein LAZ67_4003444 [Cordylochernes scorpioides]
MQLLRIPRVGPLLRSINRFARFKAGRTSVEDDLHTGRPLSIRNPENALDIKPLIKENPRITIRELSYDLDISFGTCQTIIKNDLHLKRSPAKFVPHLLTNEQKEHRKETCKNMVEMFNSDPHWLKIVIMGDETWVYGYDPETKRQSSQWLEPGEPRFKKARMIKSKLKCLPITFFDVKGLIHYEFVPEGQTTNQHHYLDALRRLREAVRQKRLEKWHQKNWLLHHENARPHTAVTVQLYLAKHGIALLPQPPYSPDLAPNDFFIYPKIKKVVNGCRFDPIPEIKENTKNIFKSLKNEDFQRCFNIWKKIWNKCKDSDVFLAEALGLVKALENATTLPDHLTLGFLLDNISVVKSVLNSRTGKYLIRRALLLISRLNRNGNRCTIQWIKGHSGTVGNDIADTFAKWEAESANPSCYKLALLSYIKATIHRRAREAWEGRFLSLGPSIHTLFGLTLMSLLDKSLDALRLRLLSICAVELGYTPRLLRDFIYNRITWRACLGFLKASEGIKPRACAEESDHSSVSDS